MSKKTSNGAVVAPHYLAIETGSRILAEGGNAIEACIAMAATLSAVYPHMGGLGGDSFWLLNAPGEAVQALHACGRSASDIDLQHYQTKGYTEIPYRGPDAAITMAGTLSGWQQAQEYSNINWQGKLPLRRLLADAIEFCERGYPVSTSQRQASVDKLAELGHRAEFSALFLSHGQPPEAGSRLRNPALGATLTGLVDTGLDAFYHGDLAKQMSADLKALGSPIARRDFHQHRAQWCQPLQLELAGVKIFTTAPPTQGLATLMILGLFARRPKGYAQRDDIDLLHWLVEASKPAIRTRKQFIRDPALMDVEAASLLRPERLERLAASLHRTQAAPWDGATSPGGTTWLGAIDGNARGVSCIQSIYHEFGSGLVLPSSGVCWHNRGAAFSLDRHDPLALRPSTLPFHTLCPSMALFDDGRRMVFGTMGGDAQPQTQASLFCRYALLGQGLQQAVSAPRWVLGKTWGDASEGLKLEGRIDAAVVAELSRRGHQVERLRDFDESVGHAGAIVCHPDGRMETGLDPRSDAKAPPGPRWPA